MKHLGVRAGRECQQRQEVAGRERQVVDRRRLQRLSGSRRVKLNWSCAALDGYRRGDLADLEGNVNGCRFGDVHLDVR